VSSVPEHVFRAYDIRGLAGNELTDDFARQLGCALSEAYPEIRSLIVGRDGRESSEMLAHALTQSLLESGITVHDAGLLPTPALYFATHEFGSGSGVMVTGSHNPSEYNGFKMMMAGHTLAGEEIQNLRTHFSNDAIPQISTGPCHNIDVTKAYIRRVTSGIQLHRPMRIALDAGNGAAGPLAVATLRACGATVTPLYCEIDGTFPHHHPNPSDPANLQDLQDRVRSEQLDLGVALDGDGDRCGIVDDQGEILWPDRQLMVHARDVLQRAPGSTVVFDVKCSGLLPRVIEEAGGTAVMARTGHSFIKGRMLETGAALGGEMSGHLFFKERWYGFDDGIYAAARLLEILSTQTLRSSEVFAALPQACATPEITLPCAEDGAQHRFIEQFSERAIFPGARLTRLDGVRADFDDGFGLVRASNTTPCLVLRFEGVDENVLQRIQKSFKEQMHQTDPDLKMPF